VARSVAWLVAVFFAVGCSALTYRRDCTDMFWKKFILVKTGLNCIRHVQTWPIKFILFVLIPGLFYVYSGPNPGLNCLDQFWQSPNNNNNNGCLPKFV
jgi:hypothetical protein